MPTLVLLTRKTDKYIFFKLIILIFPAYWNFQTFSKDFPDNFLKSLPTFRCALKFPSVRPENGENRLSTFWDSPVFLFSWDHLEGPCDRPTIKLPAALSRVSRSAHNSFASVPQGSVIGPILFIVYTSKVANVANTYGVVQQKYADVAQLYVAMSNDVIC